MGIWEEVEDKEAVEVEASASFERCTWLWDNNRWNWRFTFLASLVGTDLSDGGRDSSMDSVGPLDLRLKERDLNMIVVIQ